jgi:Tetratricopeptide repeat
MTAALLWLGVLVCAQDAPMKVSEELGKAVNSISAAGLAGDEGRVIALAEQAVRDLSHVLGPEHSDVARMLDILARIYLQRQRLDDAEKAEERALTIVEKALGQDHPGNAHILSILSEIKAEKRRYHEAELLA